MIGDNKSHTELWAAILSNLLVSTYCDSWRDSATTRETDLYYSLGEVQSSHYKVSMKDAQDTTTYIIEAHTCILFHIITV